MNRSWAWLGIPTDEEEDKFLPNFKYLWLAFPAGFRAVLEIKKKEQPWLLLAKNSAADFCRKIRDDLID
jgi:hypothetical protein